MGSEILICQKKTTPKTKCSLLENDIQGGKNLNTMDIN